MDVHVLLNSYFFSGIVGTSIGMISRHYYLGDTLSISTIYDILSSCALATMCAVHINYFLEKKYKS